MKNRTAKKYARVAQWLEHWSSKPGVDSSILSSGINSPSFFVSNSVPCNLFINLSKRREKALSAIFKPISELFYWIVDDRI